MKRHYIIDSQSGFACEREELILSCPSGRTILMTSAVYGQYSPIITCETGCCMPHPTRDCQESLEQYAPQDWAVLQLACNGLSYCNFTVPSGSVFTCEEPYYLNYMIAYHSCVPGQLSFSFLIFKL